MTNTNAWAKAGIMFRNSLDPSSAFADLSLTTSKAPLPTARVTPAAISNDRCRRRHPVGSDPTRNGNQLHRLLLDQRHDLDADGGRHDHDGNATVYVGLVTSHNSSAGGDRHVHQRIRRRAPSLKRPRWPRRPRPAPRP